LKTAGSLVGLVAAVMSVFSMSGCFHDKETACALVPTALSWTLVAVSRGRESFAEVQEFVDSRPGDIVISGACEAMVTTLIQDRDQTVSFDLMLPAGSTEVTQVDGVTLVRCLNYQLYIPREQCFRGERPPP
jgi:hypothetical protein